MNISWKHTAEEQNRLKNKICYGSMEKLETGKTAKRLEDIGG